MSEEADGRVIAPSTRQMGARVRVSVRVGVRVRVRVGAEYALALALALALAPTLALALAPTLPRACAGLMPPNSKQLSTALRSIATTCEIQGRSSGDVAQIQGRYRAASPPPAHG